MGHVIGWHEAHGYPQLPVTYHKRDRSPKSSLLYLSGDILANSRYSRVAYALWRLVKANYLKLASLGIVGSLSRTKKADTVYHNEEYKMWRG